MDSSILILEPKNCIAHNQPILLYDSNSNERSLICMQEKLSMIPVESYLQQLKDNFQKSKKQCKNDIKLLQDWNHSILSYKQQLITSLDKIMKIITDQVETIKQQVQKIRSSSSSKEQMDELQLQLSNQQQKNQQVKKIIMEQLKEFQVKNFQNVEQLLLNQNSTSNELFITQTQQNQQKTQLIATSSLQYDNTCQAFAFNKEGNILAIARNNIIILTQVEKIKITKELQQLTHQTHRINCLYFMKNCNSLVSGSQEKSIIIWECQNEEKKWSEKQILKQHTDQVNCIQMNKAENLLISCSSDKSIIFWKKINMIWQCLQAISTTNCLLTMSLNDKEDKLISCGNGDSISVLMNGNDQRWEITQNIPVSSVGSGLCFTYEDQFVYQPAKSNSLEVYGYDQLKNQFIIRDKIEIQQENNSNLGFPCQYGKNFQMLAVKSDKFLNIFKVSLNQKYQLSKSLEFNNNQFFYKLADDSQCLAKWDDVSKELQLSQLMFSK